MPRFRYYQTHLDPEPIAIITLCVGTLAMELKVSTVWESGKLKRTFKEEAGERINTYIISADGKTLTMQVSVTSAQLRPLTYKLVYQRSK
ncbi:MAG TPA: hypothetical protein VKA78_01960 [Pyrinomonadaceae bacterium]|nr:hypothetical protein [Pyrinomonadaceae bacterium]